MWEWPTPILWAEWAKDVGVGLARLHSLLPEERQTHRENPRNVRLEQMNT